MSNGMYEAAVAYHLHVKPKREPKMKALLARLHVKPKRVAPHTATSEFINLECSVLSENGWIWASEGGMKRRKAALLTGR